MAITTAITRKLDNDFVQVEIYGKNQPVRYYKVPVKLADSFQSEYIKNSKKMYRLSSILNISAIIGAIGLTLIAAKNMTNKILKYVLSAAAGIAAGVIATISGQKTAVKNHQDFLKNYNAEEIDYSEKKSII